MHALSPQTDTDSCARHVEVIHKEFSSQLKLLRKALQPKTAVPTAKVFVSALTIYLT